MNETQINKLVILFFNLATITVTAFTGVSIFIANNLWKTVIEMFWSTQFMIAMALGVGFLTLYLFYDISVNVFGKIFTNFKKLEEEIGERNKEIALLNAIITELDYLNIDTKPIKELTETEMIVRDEKMSKLQVILEKIKNARELSKLSINVELTKKMN